MQYMAEPITALQLWELHSYGKITELHLVLVCQYFSQLYSLFIQFALNLFLDLHFIIFNGNSLPREL